MKRIAEGIIGTKPDETRGLGLFTPAPPEPTQSIFPAPVAQMPGAGQAARESARARQTQGTKNSAYRILAMALEGVGPSTRQELADITGMPVNTVNARISEMRARTDEYRVVTDGRRGSESICHLARKHSLTFSEG